MSIKDTIKCFAVFAACVLFLAFIAVTHAYGEEERVYARVVVVTNLNFDEDIVEVEDAIGFIWEFDGVEDYAIGDIIAMVMMDRGSPDTILDDEILDTSYSGYEISDFTYSKGL